MSTLVRQMKREKKREGKRFELKVLANTQSETFVARFLDLDGLECLVTWLHERDEENPEEKELLTAILNQLNRLPVTAELLKRSHAGKEVNKLQKNTRDPEIKKKAENLVRRWKHIYFAGREGARSDDKPAPHYDDPLEQLKSIGKRKHESSDAFPPGIEDRAKRLRYDEQPVYGGGPH